MTPQYGGSHEPVLFQAGGCGRDGGTSNMTQREDVWYICKSVCMCKVSVYVCAHTHRR